MSVAEVVPELSGPGVVVVDIGGDIGAAAVSVPGHLVGCELEIRRTGDEWSGTHVAVRDCPMGDQSISAALFPALVAGEYEIRLKGDAASSLGRFIVIGGEVTRFATADRR